MKTNKGPFWSFKMDTATEILRQIRKHARLTDWCVCYTPTKYTPTKYTPTEYTPTEYTPTEYTSNNYGWTCHTGLATFEDAVDYIDKNDYMTPQYYIRILTVPRVYTKILKEQHLSQQLTPPVVCEPVNH